MHDMPPKYGVSPSYWISTRTQCLPSPTPLISTRSAVDSVCFFSHFLLDVVGIGESLHRPVILLAVQDGCDVIGS